MRSVAFVNFAVPVTSRLPSFVHRHQKHFGHSPFITSRNTISTRRSVFFIELPLHSTTELRTFTTTTKMAVPTVDELRTGTFPATVDLAGTVLREAGTTRPDLLSALASTSQGARGLFVALLADGDLAIADADPLDDALVSTLVDAGNGTNHAVEVRSLAVKNVVMPAAMVIQYGAQGQLEEQASSRLTCERAVRVLKAWAKKEDDLGITVERNGTSVRQVVEEMRSALAGGNNAYSVFIKKWKYDEAQRTAMMEALQKVLPST